MRLHSGWGIDREGRVTTDPDATIAGGALLPLGSVRERGGHKGYALAIMVNVEQRAQWRELGAICPSFALRHEIPERSVGRGIGHFFGAMRIDGFIDADLFKSQVDEYVRVFRATKPAPGTKGPLIPGDPERETEQLRRETGIPLIAPVRPRPARHLREDRYTLRLRLSARFLADDCGWMRGTRK